MTVRLSLLATLAAAFALATTATAGAATPPNPCTTVAKADAAKALGAPVTGVKAGTAGPSASCTFRGPRLMQAVVVTAFRYDSPADANARFGDMVKQTAAAMSAPAAKLNGIGDDAVAIFSSVYTRKGPYIYVFNVFGQRNPALTARAGALAKATMARIR